MQQRHLVKISALFLALQACSGESPETIDLVSTYYQFPTHFGQPDIPSDNELSAVRIELGRRLFYDKRLSATGEVACASCHIQKYAFSDTTAVSRGIHERHGMRNAPTLTNVAYQPYMFMDGGTKNLETQVLAPLQDTNELGKEIHEVVAELDAIEMYHNLAMKGYDRKLDHYVLVRALASFERTIISSDSKFDQFISGDKGVFSDLENEGWQLFKGKLNCVACHAGPQFTNYSFQNNGAFYENTPDSGRMRVTFAASDRNKFKVPTLRNIELTAPYMHDGSFKTLDDVIDHYESGGKDTKGKSQFILPNELTLKERKALKAFLMTLTDEKFIANKNLGPLND